MLMLAACFAFVGVVISFAAISIGVGEVVLSIYNVSVVFQVILAAICLHQMITSAQIAGVVFCVFGAAMVSLGDKIPSSIKSK